jgi:hypothetical protein
LIYRQTDGSSSQADCSRSCAIEPEARPAIRFLV